MSKNIKRILALALFMVLAGGVLITLGFLTLGWNIYALDNQEYTHHVVASDGELISGGEVKKIVVEIDDWDIIFVEGDSFGLEYYTTEESSAEISFENNVFTIKESFNWNGNIINLRWFRGIKKSTLSYTFTVPKGADIELDCSNTDVNAENIAFGSLGIKSKNSDIYLKNISASNISYDGNNSDLYLKNVTANQDIKIECANGDTEIEDISVAGTAQLSTANSTAKIEKSSFVDLKVSSSNSTLRIKESVFVQDIKASSSNDRFYLQEVNADSFNVNASNTKADIEDSTLRQLDCNFKNGRLVADDSTFDSIIYRGDNSRFSSEGVIAFESFSFTGDNSTVTVTTRGSKSSFSEIKMTGSNSTFRINGDKESHHSGSGSRTFKAIGNNSRVELNFV